MTSVSYFACNACGQVHKNALSLIVIDVVQSRATGLNVGTHHFCNMACVAKWAQGFVKEKV